MELVTGGQKFALIKLCQKFTQSRNGRLYLLSSLIEEPIKSTSDITKPEWQAIRNSAYPNWSDNDWAMCDEFKAKCQTIISKFEEEVLGQLKINF